MALLEVFCQSLAACEGVTLLLYDLRDGVRTRILSMPHIGEHLAPYLVLCWRTHWASSTLHQPADRWLYIPIGHHLAHNRFEWHL